MTVQQMLESYNHITYNTLKRVIFDKSVKYYEDLGVDDLGNSVFNIAFVNGFEVEVFVEEQYMDNKDYERSPIRYKERCKDEV